MEKKIGKIDATEKEKIIVGWVEFKGANFFTLDLWLALEEMERNIWEAFRTKKISLEAKIYFILKIRSKIKKVFNIDVTYDLGRGFIKV